MMISMMPARPGTKLSFESRFALYHIRGTIVMAPETVPGEPGASAFAQRSWTCASMAET